MTKIQIVNKNFLFSPRQEILFIISHANSDKLIPYLVKMPLEFFGEPTLFDFCTYSFRQYYLHIKKYRLKINNQDYVKVFSKIFEYYNSDSKTFPFSLFFIITKILSFNNAKLSTDMINSIMAPIQSVFKSSYIDFLPALKSLINIEEIALQFAEVLDFYKSLFHSLDSRDHFIRKKSFKLFQGILQFEKSRQKFFGSLGEYKSLHPFNKIVYSLHDSDFDFKSSFFEIILPIFKQRITDTSYYDDIIKHATEFRNNLEAQLLTSTPIYKLLKSNLF